MLKNIAHQKLSLPFKCIQCYQNFRGFYALRQRKDTQHGFPINPAVADPDDIINEVYSMFVKEELRSLQRFLVASQLQRVRQKTVHLCCRKPQHNSSEREV